MQKVMDLRHSFIEFFREKNHRIVPSSSLVPKDDPTLLFTTAGMVQFKPMFAGTVDLEYTRAASVQKCFRTSDLENVGKTKRHLTLFEMLGNFSFGDYFKKEAIEFAWEYSTSVIGFPPEKIWVSIYEDDDEAFQIWHRHIGVPAEKIVRLGKKDNFWGPAGDSGACGPCSELYLDRGAEFGCGADDCKPGCECERFLEYWNLVFNQFNQDINGNLHPLPRTGIDTGMGLERLATLVQNVDSIYETDEFKGLIEFITEKTGVPYTGENIVPMRVMAEHARALTFAMSDGIYPSNDGRGYVLRRILRRALRYSRQIGIKDPFIYSMADPVVRIMGDFYPEIKGSVKNVKAVIESEEKRFLETIENGMDRLEEIIKSARKKGDAVISGKDVFILYDTFGFPLEMTEEIVLEQGLKADRDGFEQEMEAQRKRGKESWKGAEAGLEKLFEDGARKAGDTVFKGYDENETESVIQLLYDHKEEKELLRQGETGLVILKETSFYGESGGQVGDVGEIITDSGAVFRVDDTKKFNKTIIHMGEMTRGELRKGATVMARIDTVNRNLIRANHTATHLLQAALRSVLGEHVKQAGSIVDPERLRFDFSHFNAMSDEEIQRVESIVNEKIWENIQVATEKMNLDDAVKSGAMAVFDEKYEEAVRVITVNKFSKELCGGTHVDNTGKIGVFKIVRESSPGAGVRRVEATTLKGVLDRYTVQEKLLAGVVEKLNVTEGDVLKRLEDVVEKSRSLEKELEKIKKQNLSSGIEEIMASGSVVKGVKIITHHFADVETAQLRELSDAIREREQNALVCLGSEVEGKAVLLYAATKKAVEAGIDCGALIKETVKLVGGGGGGRKDMAQAGGKSPVGLKNALDEALKLASSMIK